MLILISIYSYDNPLISLSFFFGLCFFRKIKITARNAHSVAMKLIGMDLLLLSCASAIASGVSLLPPASFDGSGRNLQYPEYGAVGEPSILLFGAAEQPPLDPNVVLPNPRLVSEMVFGRSTASNQYSSRRVNDLALTFAELIAHDIFSAVDNRSQPINVPVPECDQGF